MKVRFADTITSSCNKLNAGRRQSVTPPTVCIAKHLNRNTRAECRMEIIFTKSILDGGTKKSIPNFRRR